jgi:hypothetical protein
MKDLFSFQNIVNARNTPLGEINEETIKLSEWKNLLNKASEPLTDQKSQKKLSYLLLLWPVN